MAHARLSRFDGVSTRWRHIAGLGPTELGILLDGASLPLLLAMFLASSGGRKGKPSASRLVGDRATPAHIAVQGRDDVVAK